MMILITRLTVLANRNNHPLYITTEEDPWTCLPLFNLVSLGFAYQLLFFPHRNFTRASHVKPMVMTVVCGFYA